MQKELLCDLHIHSTFSDGADTPQELITAAQKAGLRAVALCDHNTVAGLADFEEAAISSGVIAVPGIEITSAYEGCEVHMLGLFVDGEARLTLNRFLAELNARKEASNRDMLLRLQEGGYAVDYETVQQIAGAATPNRVHVANALLQKGYVSSLSEAFSGVLKEGRGFYVPAEKPEALDVVVLLSALKALPVLAHPFLNLSEAQLQIFLPKAHELGLVGMETRYSLFSQEQTAMADYLAMRFGLLPSGGSDYHGSNKPDIQMGRGKGGLAVPFSYYQALAVLSEGGEA